MAYTKMTPEQMQARDATTRQGVEKYLKLEKAIQEKGFELVAGNRLGSQWLAAVRANGDVRNVIYTGCARGGHDIQIAVSVFGHDMDEKSRSHQAKNLRLAAEIFVKTGGIKDGKVVGRAVARPAGKIQFRQMLDSLTADQLAMFGIDPNIREFSSSHNFRGVSAMDILEEVQGVRMSDFQALWIWAHLRPAPRLVVKKVPAAADDVEATLLGLAGTDTPEAPEEAEDPEADELESVGGGELVSGGEDDLDLEETSGGAVVAVVATASDEAGELAELLEEVGKPVPTAMARKLRDGSATYADTVAKAQKLGYL